MSANVAGGECTGDKLDRARVTLAFELPDGHVDLDYSSKRIMVRRASSCEMVRCARPNFRLIETLFYQ